MKVYVSQYLAELEGQEIVGVYKSKGKAEKAVIENYREHPNRYLGDYDILEFEVQE